MNLARNWRFGNLAIFLVWIATRKTTLDQNSWGDRDILYQC